MTSAHSLLGYRHTSCQFGYSHQRTRLYSQACVYVKGSKNMFFLSCIDVLYDFTCNSQITSVILTHFTWRKWCKMLFCSTFDTWLISIWMKKISPTWSTDVDFDPVDFSRWPAVLLWFLGWIPCSSISEKLSGWWKDVMKSCDIALVDELTAKLWPGATSLLLTDWLSDSQDMQSFINSTHWQRGTLRPFHRGRVSTVLSVKWQTGCIYLYKMWMSFTFTWTIVLAVWKNPSSGKYVTCFCSIVKVWTSRDKVNLSVRQVMLSY